MSWREKVHEKVKQHLETQISQTVQHKDAYERAEDPALAQLWVAVANLSRQMYELNVKIAMFDEALREGVMQREAALQKLLAEKHAAKGSSVKKKVSQVKRKAKKVVAERVKRSVRATAAKTAKKVAEKVAKETVKRSARTTAAITAKKAAKRKSFAKKSAKNKRQFILLKEA
ncbi:MAG: hypothetical protein Q7R56_03000 [Nanoarchaeota archaeon]|nr:hypothetical protein [Nanoarchaeota archaeon]